MRSDHFYLQYCNQLLVFSARSRNLKLSITSFSECTGPPTVNTSCSASSVINSLQARGHSWVLVGGRTHLVGPLGRWWRCSGCLYQSTLTSLF